jgi:hypothetical protein
MRYTNRQFHLRSIVLFALAMGLSIRCEAHVEWTRVNDADPECVALYHFDEHAGEPGSLLEVAPGLAVRRGLTVGPADGTPMNTGHDTPGAIFEPHALLLNATQTAESTAMVHQLDGDLTIECWLKWNAGLTSQTLELGLSSGARLTIARDTANPANDRIGLTFTHGDYASASGFTNWVDVGDEEASLDEWRHVGVTIRSAGIHFDSVSGHDVYSTGTLARFYLNGHATGAAPHTADLTGMRVHDASKIRVQSIGGQMKIDEFTIWSRDWSANGTIANPFAEGRGEGVVSAAEGWSDYR